MAERGGRAVNRMVCEDCGTPYFSAAARTMVERGERCDNCGGRLTLDEESRETGARIGSDDDEDTP
jgi:DNA-directed RNA polymerase subunit RPC12/RpoP